MNDAMNKSSNHKKDEIKKIWQRCRLPKGQKGVCPDEELLAAYLDHRLSGDQLESMERHLLQCDSCFSTVLFMREALDSNETADALSQKEIQQLFDLVPRDSHPGKGILDRLSRFLSLRLVSAPAFALSMILICGLGFYAGMQTRMDQDFYHKQVAAELSFFFDNPAPGYKPLTEGE